MANHGELHLGWDLAAAHSGDEVVMLDPSSTLAKVAKRQDPLFMGVCGV